MKLLEERIKEDGQVRPGNILKVDSFLNHQLDISLLEQLGNEFYEKFKDKGITRILTIEASGIALACLAAQHFKVQAFELPDDESRLDIASQSLFYAHSRTPDRVVLRKEWLPEGHPVGNCIHLQSYNTSADFR